MSFLNLNWYKNTLKAFSKLLSLKADLKDGKLAEAQIPESVARVDQVAADLAAVEQALASSQADFAVNDESNAAHILNRTHHRDENVITHLDAVSVVVHSNNYIDFYDTENYFVQNLESFEPGKEYIVVRNGESYKCVASPATSEDIVYLGDYSGVSQYKYPFKLRIKKVSDYETEGFPLIGYALAGQDADVGTVVYSIFSTEYTYHPLDEQYIPDSIARTEQVEQVREELAASQADQNVNDPENPAHILNRTHWVSVDKDVILAEAVRANRETVNIPKAFDSMASGVVVVIDGVRYETTNYSGEYGKGYAVGNGAIYNTNNFENTGEPFCLWNWEAGGPQAIVCFEDGGSHTIEVFFESTSYHQLDPKFIPDAITIKTWSEEDV